MSQSSEHEMTFQKMKESIEAFIQKTNEALEANIFDFRKFLVDVKKIKSSLDLYEITENDKINNADAGYEYIHLNNNFAHWIFRTIAAQIKTNLELTQEHYNLLRAIFEDPSIIFPKKEMVKFYETLANAYQASYNKNVITLDQYLLNLRELRDHIQEDSSHIFVDNDKNKNEILHGLNIAAATGLEREGKKIIEKFRFSTTDFAKNLIQLIDFLIRLDKLPVTGFTKNLNFEIVKACREKGSMIEKENLANLKPEQSRKFHQIKDLSKTSDIETLLDFLKERINAHEKYLNSWLGKGKGQYFSGKFMLSERQSSERASQLDYLENFRQIINIRILHGEDAKQLIKMLWVISELFKLHIGDKKDDLYIELEKMSKACREKISADADTLEKKALSEAKAFSEGVDYMNDPMTKLALNDIIPNQDIRESYDALMMQLIKSNEAYKLSKKPAQKPATPPKPPSPPKPSH